MQALINAGGKGTRMGACGIEKPMQIIGGKPSVLRVVEALKGSEYIDGILVSVSDNTPETEKYLNSLGIKTLRTSGESFMDDLHEAFGVMDGQFVLTCPSDVPLLSSEELDKFAESFIPGDMESHIALVEEEIVREIGIAPSFVLELYGKSWAISGLSIMDRVKTLNGAYLADSYYCTDCKEFAVNMNTQKDLQTVKSMF